MTRRPVTSPRHPTACETCEAEIFFATAPSGKVMPVDAAPRADGAAAVRCDRSGGWRARILGPGDQLGPDERKHMPHWVTCPRADAFRKCDRRPPPAPRPAPAPKFPSPGDQPALF